jgi:hypothetical protein
VWREAGLVHGDIKPGNTVVEHANRAALRLVQTYIIDCETVVELPRRRPVAGKPLPHVYLRSFTREFLADPKHGVGTATSDLFALGCTIRYVMRVSSILHCSSRVVDRLYVAVTGADCLAEVQRRSASRGDVGTEYLHRSDGSRWRRRRHAERCVSRAVGVCKEGHRWPVVRVAGVGVRVPVNEDCRDDASQDGANCSGSARGD